MLMLPVIIERCDVWPLLQVQPDRKKRINSMDSATFKV